MSENQMRWCFYILVALYLLIFAGWANWGWISHQSLCDATENWATCFRSWLSSLSGWAAAIAAGITIRSLFRQANAAQLQTDFMIGDAEPTIDAVQHVEDPKSVVLRIRNWNRRSMILRSIKLVGAREVTFLHFKFDKGFLQTQHIDDWKGLRFHAFVPELVFTPSILLEGWITREGAPPLLKLQTLASTDVGEYLTAKWGDVSILVTYEMVGQGGHKSQEVWVHMVTSHNSMADDFIDDIELNDQPV